MTPISSQLPARPNCQTGFGARSFIPSRTPSALRAVSRMGVPVGEFTRFDASTINTPPAITVGALRPICSDTSAILRQNLRADGG